MEDVNTSYKMATALVIMCFVLSIGLSLLWISRAFWNRTADSIERSVISTETAELWQTASQGAPVPVAAIKKVLAAVPVAPMDTYSGDGTTVTRYAFTIRENGAVLTQDYKNIDDYLDRKAYLSYEEVAGLFYVEIDLAG